MKRKQEAGVIIVIVLAIIVTCGIIAIVINGVVNFEGGALSKLTLQMGNDNKKLGDQIEGQVKKILPNDKLLVFSGEIDTVNPLLDKTSGSKISKVIYRVYTYDLNTKEKRNFENIAFYDNHTISPDGKYLIYEKFRLWEEAGQAINILNTETGEVSNIKFPSKVNLTNTYWIDDRNFFIGLENRSILQVNVENRSLFNFDIEGRSNAVIIGGNSSKLYYYIENSVYPQNNVIVKERNLVDNSVRVINNSPYSGSPKYCFYQDGYIVYGQDILDNNFNYSDTIIRRYNFDGQLIKDIGTLPSVGYAEDFKISSDGKYLFHKKHNGIEKQQVEAINLDTKKTTVLVKASEIVDIQYDNRNNKLIVNARDKYDPKVYSYILSEFENVEFVECLTKQENIDNAYKAEEILNNRINGGQKPNMLYKTVFMNGKVYYCYDADSRKEYPHNYFISLDGDIIENGVETSIEYFDSNVLPRVPEIIQRKY